MKAEKVNATVTKAEVGELLSWAEYFCKADIGTKHMIKARLIERVELRADIRRHIKFRISLDQYLGKTSA